MSVDRSHDAVDLGFLGHLIERTQPQTMQIRTPILERRRPGIFEPRAPVASAAIDIEDAIVEPSVSSLTRIAVPAAQASSHASAIAAPSLVLKTITPTAVESVATSAPQMMATSHAALVTTSSSLPVTTRQLREVADAAPHRARDSAAPEALTNRRSTPTPKKIDSSSSTSPLRPHIVAPPALATRGEKIVRVEHSRLESRTTIVEREIDKDRNPSVSAVQAPMLIVPPRLANSEAQRAPVAHPVRSAAMAAAPLQQTPPVPAPVHVSIGRIEIRASGAAAPAMPRNVAAKPQLGLDEYLQQRHGNGR